MRTTVTLSDALLRKAKVIAAKRGTFLKDVLEEGLREVIRLDSQQVDPHRPPLVLPVSKRARGTHPGIDLNNNAQIQDILDQEDVERMHANERRERPH